MGDRQEHYVHYTFHNMIIKVAIGAYFEIDLTQMLESSLWHQSLMPSIFIRVFLGSTLATFCSNTIRPLYSILITHLVDGLAHVSSLGTDISPNVAKRMTQIVAEYLVVLHGGYDLHAVADERLSATTIAQSLGMYYVNSEYELQSCHLEKLLAVDVKVFNTVAVNIVSSCGSYRGIRKCRQLIMWYKALLSPNSRRVFLDVTTVSITTLLEIQRIHEESQRRFHPLTDYTSYGSTWNTVLKEPSSVPAVLVGSTSCWNTYKHSELLRDGVCSKTCGINDVSAFVTVNAMYKERLYTLILHNGKRRPLSQDDVEGLLNILWLQTNVLYCHKLVEHHLMEKHFVLKDTVCDNVAVNELLKSEFVIHRIGTLIEEVHPTKQHKTAVSHVAAATTAPVTDSNQQGCGRDQHSENSVFPIIPEDEIGRLAALTAEDYERLSIEGLAYSDDYLLWLTGRLITSKCLTT